MIARVLSWLTWGAQDEHTEMSQESLKQAHYDYKMGGINVVIRGFWLLFPAFVFFLALGCSNTKAIGIENKYKSLLGVKIQKAYWHPAFDDIACRHMDPREFDYRSIHFGMSYSEFVASVGSPSIDWKLDFPIGDGRSWKKDQQTFNLHWVKESEALDKYLRKQFGRRSLVHNLSKAESVLSTLETIGTRFVFSASLPSLLFYFIEIKMPGFNKLDSVTILNQFYDLYASPAGFQVGLVPFLSSKNKFIWRSYRKDISRVNRIQDFNRIIEEQEEKARKELQKILEQQD